MKSKKGKSKDNKDNNNLKFFFAYWMPLLIYCGFIFYMSSITVFPGGISRVDDRLKHAAEYLFLGILVFRLVDKTRYKRLNYLIIISFCLLYGVSDEIHQYFVPGRIFSHMDMAFDGLGGVFVVLFDAIKKRI